MNDIIIRTKLYFYFLLPALTTLLLITLSIVNFKIPGVTHFMPLFSAMSIFYWVIYAPNFMPKWLAFFIGLFQDMLYGTPLGVSSLINIILWTIIFSQRRFLVRETFTVVWGIFIITSTIICLVNWILISALMQQFVFYETVVMQWVVSATIYPLLHRMFSSIFSAILRNF